MSAFDIVRSELGPIERVAVLGAGAWGTALAATAARAGRSVTLWARRPDVARAINRTRRNERYLGDIALPDGIHATSDLSDAVADTDVILLVTPSNSIRAMARLLAPVTPATTPIIVCAKGIEPESGLLMTEIVEEEMRGQPVGVLSGPTFADEAALEHPTAVTIASSFDTNGAGAVSASLAGRTAVALSNSAFRAYVSDDVTGVEVGGAMKNVIAIACGVASGAGFRANMRAALITRGLDEMKQLAEVLGGRRETVTGLSGIGDLMLTCSSEQSRNLRFGMEFGRGVRREDTFGGAPVVVEGVLNSISVTDLARRHGVELPICEAVRAMVHEGADVAGVLTDLWARPLEAEPRAIDATLTHPAPDDVRARMEAMIG